MHVVNSLLTELIFRNGRALTRKARDRRKAALAIKRLNEELTIFEHKEKDLHEFEMRLDKFSGQTEYCCDVVMKDKIEAFHQQVYIVISLLAALLSNVGIKGKKDFPFGRVEKFLEYISQKMPDSIDPILLNTIEKSRRFRSEIVIHPQQHQLHDWRILNFGGHYYVFYFIPQEKVEVPEHLEILTHPIPEEFVPPFPCKNYYLSPNRNVTFIATCELISSLLELGYSTRLHKIR